MRAQNAGYKVAFRTMETKDALNHIREALKQLEASGQQLVSVKALGDYLNQLEKNATMSIEFQKLQHESNLAHYRATREAALDMFRSVIGFAQYALKTIILVNGGAAVAMLALIGNIWSKESSVEVAKAIACSEAYFAFGVLIGAIATSTAYFTQYFYERASKYPNVAIGFHIATIVLVVGSYVTFGLGVYAAYSAFAQHLAR